MHMASPLKLFPTKQKKLPDDVQLRFLKRMHRFLSNGYSLQHTLEAIAWDRDLAVLSNVILERLKQGDKLDNIFQKVGFHPSINVFLHFVTVNSNVVRAIEKCIDMMEHRMVNVKKFKTTIRYPMILLFIFSLLLIFINHQVLPAFQSLMQTSPQAMTTITILTWGMDFFQLLLVLSTITLFIVAIIWRYTKGKLTIHQQLYILNRIPLYRYFLRIQTSFQFATHFSSLLKAGLSMKEILEELANQKRLPAVSYYAQLLTENLQHGFHLSSLLEELPFIERQLAIIFQKNATTHDLEKDLTFYSDMLLEEMQRVIEKVITFTQPIFYIALGLCIIFIYLSIMWPMFQLMNSM